MTATMEAPSADLTDRGSDRGSDRASRRGRGWVALVAALCGVAAIALLLIVVWPDGSAAISNHVGVTEREFTLELSATAAHPGKVTFRVSNAGKLPHEFVVFRTAVAADAMPAGSNGRFNEDSPLVHNVIDSGGDIAPGHSATFSANLPAGHYVAVCNLPGHYAHGMRADFTVK
jgi:uncharacterized cupredoxin-like copper-binding protein